MTQPPRARMILGRGLTARCGRCGGRRIFAGYFRLQERCPRCGYRFVREAGAFTGVLLLNLVVTLTLMFVSFASYVVWRGTVGSVSIAPFAAVGLVLAVIMPIVAYPLAWSTWVALDLATRPLDPDEELEAWAHEDRRPHLP